MYVHQPIDRWRLRKRLLNQYLLASLDELDGEVFFGPDVAHQLGDPEVPGPYVPYHLVPIHSFLDRPSRPLYRGQESKQLDRWHRREGGRRPV